MANKIVSVALLLAIFVPIYFFLFLMKDIFLQLYSFKFKKKLYFYV